MSGPECIKGPCQEAAGPGTAPRDNLGARPAVLRGFTLIELLVAIAIMSMLALLSWRVVADMSRAQTLTEQRARQVLQLQSAIGQWVADLDAVIDTQDFSPLSFDGRVLRLTRRDTATSDQGSPALRVVAWARQDGQWRRWQSGALRQGDEWARAWQRAALWGQGQAIDPALGGSVDSVVDVAAVDSWEIFYHRGETWTNPLSAVGNEANTPTANSALPNGVRLVLTLTAGQALGGRIIRDWVRPTLEAGET